MKEERKKNPLITGRPKGSLGKVTGELRKLAQPYGKRSLQVLSEIMEDVEMQPAARVSAAKELLDRGYGKSMQAIEMSGPDGGDIPLAAKAVSLTREELERIAKGD